MRRNYIIIGASFIIIASVAGLALNRVDFNNSTARYQQFDATNLTHRELFGVAKLAIDTDVELEMFPESDVKAKDDPRIAAAMLGRFEGSKRVYEGLRDKKMAPATRYLNELEDVKVSFDGNTAVMLATQHEQKFYSGYLIGTDALGKVDRQLYPSQGFVHHQFNFQFENGKWILTRDLRLDDDSENYIGGSDEDSNSLFTKINIKDIRKGMSFNISLVNQNIRSNVVQYAYRYYQNENPTYKKMDNDCTNFTSQSLYNGGWAMVPGDPRDSVNSWYYIFGVNYPSLTWSKAEYFRDFCFYRDDRVRIVDPRELVPGDIMQVKWNEPGNPGYHSMVITRIAADGDPLFTQHSLNFADHSLAELKSRYRNAIWYGWHLKIPDEISITNISPNLSVGQGTWITVIGTNFSPAMKASVNQWQIADSGVQFKNSSSIRVFVVMNNRGTFTLMLRKQDGTYARKNFSVS